jgi:hypothetical protein
MNKDTQVLNQIKHKLGDWLNKNGKQEAIQIADQHLKAIGYGNKRDYNKIVVDGYPTVTTWAKNHTIAKIAWVAQHGYIPSTEVY